MKTFVDYFYLTLLSLCGLLLLCSVFVVSPEAVNGTVVGKVSWFNWSMLLFSFSLLLIIIIKKGNIPYIIAIPDWCVISFLIVVAGSYQWFSNPAPGKVAFVFQLGVLWFLMRATFQMFPQVIHFFLFIIMYSGLIEALWGFGQLYNITGSYHSVFRITGSFYNPGPYSGYLAVMFPITMGLSFYYRRKAQSTLDPNMVLYICTLLSLVLIITLLPATMSRASWIAAIISGIWVLWMELSFTERLKHLWKSHRGILLVSSVIVLFLCIGAAVGTYSLKKDSADGRLLMWKITTNAILDNSMMSVGIGGFSDAYSNAQESYFASGEASPREAIVAGSPEYAFNEYLQLILEEGIFGFLIFMGLAGFCFYFGVKNKQIAACGGLISLGILCFFSYPMQLPSFKILTVLLLTLVIMPIRRPFYPRYFQHRRGCARAIVVCSIVAFLLSSFITWGQIGTYNSYHQWSNLKVLQQTKAYESALSEYEKLYPRLKHESAFLFEYAQCLTGLKQYDKANDILKKAAVLSTDPMIYNVMAKNYQALGKYSDAEKYLYKSLNLLPERIYPYYLLTKLYAEPAFYQPDKMKKAGELVLTKEPKVQSTAIKEMRNEIKKLLAEKNIKQADLPVPEP